MALNLPELNVPSGTQPQATSERKPLVLPDLQLPELDVPKEEATWSDVGKALVDRVVPTAKRSGEALLQFPSIQAADTQNGTIAMRIQEAGRAARDGDEQASQLLASIGITPADLDSKGDSFKVKREKNQKLYAAIDKFKELQVLSKDTGYAESQKRMAQDSKDLKAVTPEVDPWSGKGLALNLGSALQDMVPAIAAGVATRSPAVGLAAMAPTTYGQYYSEGIDKNLTPSQAKSRASILSAIEPATTAVPLGKLLKPGANKLTDLATTAVAEGGQEMLMTAIQTGYDMGILDENVTLGQFLNDMAYSGVLGAGAGATLHGVAHGTGMIGKEKTNDTIPDVQPGATTTVPSGEYDAVAAETAGLNQPAAAEPPAPDVRISPEQYAAYKAQREQGATPVDALDAMAQQVTDSRANTTGDALDALVNDLQPASPEKALRYGLNDMQIPAYLRQQPEALQEALQAAPSRSVAQMVNEQSAQGAQGLSPLELPDNLLPAPHQTSTIAMPGPIGGESSQLNVYSPTGRVDEQMAQPIPAPRPEATPARPPLELPTLALPAPNQTSTIAMPGPVWGATGPNRPKYSPTGNVDEGIASLHGLDIPAARAVEAPLPALDLPTAFQPGDRFTMPMDAKPLGSLKNGDSYTVEGKFGQSLVLRGDDGVPYVIGDSQLSKAKIAKTAAGEETTKLDGTPASEPLTTPTPVAPSSKKSMASRGKKKAAAATEEGGTGAGRVEVTKTREETMRRGTQAIQKRIGDKMDDILAKGRQRAIDGGWKDEASYPPINDAIMANLTEAEQSRLHDLRLQAQRDAKSPAEARAAVEKRAAERKRTMAERKAKQAEPEAKSPIVEPGSDIDTRAEAWNKRIEEMPQADAEALAAAAGVKVRMPAHAKAQLRNVHPDDLDAAAAKPAVKPDAFTSDDIGTTYTQGKETVTVKGVDADGMAHTEDQNGVAGKFVDKDHAKQAGYKVAAPEISQLDRNSINDLIRQLDKPRRKLADIKADMAAMRKQNPDDPTLYDPVEDTTRSGFRRTMEARLRGEKPPVKQRKSVMGRNAKDDAIAQTEAFEASKQSMADRKKGKGKIDEDGVLDARQKGAIRTLAEKPWIERVGEDDAGLMHDLIEYNASLGKENAGKLDAEMRNVMKLNSRDEVIGVMRKVREFTWDGNEPFTNFIGAKELKKAPLFTKYLQSIVKERDAVAAQAELDATTRRETQAAEEKQAAAEKRGEYGGRSYVTLGDIRMDVIGKEGNKYIVRDALKGKDHVRTAAEVKAELEAAEVSPDHTGYEAGAYDRAKKANTGKKGVLPSLDKLKKDKSGNLTPDSVQAVVNDFKAGLKGVQNVDFTVVPKQSDLGIFPDDVTVMAFYDPGNVRVVTIAENLKSAEDVQSQLRHEVIVHYGLRARLSKPEYDAAMDRVLAAEGKDKRLDPYFKKVREDYGDVYDTDSPDGRRMIAEEVVAAVAGDTATAQKVGAIRTAIEAIRKLLIKAGLIKDSASHKDVVDLIKANTDFLRNNRVDNDDVRRSIAPMKYEAPNGVAPALRKDRRVEKADVPDDLKADMNHTQHTENGAITETVNNVMDRNYRKAAADAVYSGIIDDLDPIARYEKGANNGELRTGGESAYKMATNSRQVNSIMAAAMNQGIPVWKDGGIRIKDGSKGLMQILDPIAQMPGEMLTLWEHWAGAVRAKRLLAEGRENLYNADMVDRAINYVNSKPELRKAFNQAHKEYQEFKRGLLDFSEEAGIIDPEARKLWDQDDYVPLYRVSDETDAITAPGGKSRSFVNQSSGIKTLKGGEGKVDIINNMIRNANHLVMSSYNNRVGQMVVDLANDIGMVEVPANFKPVDISNKAIKNALNDMGVGTTGMSKAMQDEYSKMFVKAAPQGKNIVSVMFEGKRKYYEVTDPTLMRAINQVGPRTVQTWMKFFSVPKMFLTRMVTSTPDFVIRNFTRDVVSNFAQQAETTGRNSPGRILADALTLRPLTKALKGAKSALFVSPDIQAYRAAGGFSGGYDGARPDQLAHKLRNLHKPNSLLGAPVKAWHAYERVLEAGEIGTRMQVFNDVLTKTGDITEATYQANDVMNFSRRGDSVVYNFLANSVPFMNARVQGLDRMARGFKENKAAFTMKALMVTAASLALLSMNHDDERYWALNESIRDNYWVIPTDGGYVQIPKPFELGSLFGTIPERAYEAATRDDKVFWDRMGSMFLNTFAMNPIPQSVSPIVEDVANKDFFTGFSIVSEGMKFKDAPDQAGAYTREFIKDLSKSLPDSFPDALRSPTRLQHLMEGYTGSMGQYVMSGVDSLYRIMNDRPEMPAAPEGDAPLLNVFVKEGEKTSKYVSRVYEMQQQVREASAKLKQYREARDAEGMRKTMSDKRTELASKKAIEKAAKRLTDLSGETKKIIANPALDAKQKREAIDEVTRKKNEVGKEINDRFWSTLRDSK